MGGHALDRIAVEDSGALGHVARVLAEAGAPVVNLVAGRGSGLLAAPDPAGTLMSAHRENRARRVRGARLTAATYNVALLDVTIGLGDVVGVLRGHGVPTPLGPPLYVARSPEVMARRPALLDLIFSRGEDLILLQEVWQRRDIAWLTRAAADRGYRAFSGAAWAGCSDGLLTLVRSASIEGHADLAAVPFDASLRRERLASIRRGFLAVSFMHRRVGALTVFNTHLQAFPPRWRLRNLQARQLGLAARRALDQGDLVVAGGDFNAGAHYPRARWRDGPPIGFHNALSYALFAHYSGLSDLAALGRPSAQDAAAEVRAPELSSRAGWPFTANHLVNDLYRAQYGDSEPPARLDHLWGGARDRRWKAMGSEVFGTEPVTTTHGCFHPSDHFGVRVAVTVEP